MAHVRRDVAHDIKRNYALWSIVKAVIKNTNYTKWDVVKAFLWGCWYGGKSWLRKAGIFLLKCLAVLVCLLTFCVSIVFLGALAIISPVWYPVMMWLAPKRAAKLITVELYKGGDDLEWWQFASKAPFELAGDLMFTMVLKSVWGWIWRFMPMTKRQYYLEATGVELKELSVAEQLQYYLLNSSAETVRKMSFEAVDELQVQYRDASDLKNIADVYEIYLTLGKELFSGSEEMFKLLKGYCANEKKKLSAKFTGFLIETVLKGEGGELWSRASSLLLICCENHTLPNHQLIMLAAALGKDKPIGNEAKEMLERYFSRHSFPDDVIRQMINFATDGTIDECKEKNFELLCKIVRRDGLSTELSEFFFEHCDKAQKEKMADIFKIRMDCEKVGYSYDNDENRASWEQYCYLCEEISTDAQLQMKEWQYDIYRACGHKLDKDVIYELLVKRISRDDMSYFKKVLDEEADRGKLSDAAYVMMMATEWKREIILPMLEAEKKKGSDIVL